MNRQGFTLIELLIVIAIIGILAAIGIVNYTRWRASSSVMEGAQQFAQAVNSTRTGAKRANACWQIKAGPGNQQYQVTRYAGPVCSGTATPQTYTLPGRTALTGSSTAVNFTPPYGTTDAVANVYEVTWTSNPEIKRELRVTSIFGKVIVK